MKTATKAALLSALVFPGAGHFFLKKYPAAIIFISAFSIAFYRISIDLVDKVDYLLKQIEAGNVPLDLSAITELISNQTVGLDSQTSSLITSAMGVLWLLAILDSYRIGRNNSYSSFTS